MKLLSLLLILTLSAGLFAQGNPAPLSMDDCVRIALENNSQLLIAGQRLELAKKDQFGSYSNILPTLDVSVNASKFENRGSFLDPNGQPVVGTASGEAYNNGLNIGQNIYDGGFWWNSIRKARSDKAAEEFGYDLQRQSTIVTVQESYLNLLKAEKLLEVYDEAVTRSKEQLQRSESLFELGSVAKVDVYQNRVNLGNDRINYLNQKNIVRQSIVILNIAMGRNPQDPLATESEDETMEAVGDVDALIEEALKNSPVLRQQEQLYKSSKLQHKISKSPFLPRLSSFFSYSRPLDGLSQLFESPADGVSDYNWSLGLSLRWNIFNGFSDMVNVQKAKINERLTQEQTLEQRRNLIGDVKSQHNDLLALKEIIEINRTNLEASKEEYRLAAERYRVGAGTALELREAQVKLTNAEQLLVAAKYNALTTSARLKQTVGKL
ncbi:MAG: TolC family protein [Calditrichia bacterium]